MMVMFPLQSSHQSLNRCSTRIEFKVAIERAYKIEKTALAQQVAPAIRGC